MVQSVTPDDDCKLLEQEIKAKRFSYNKGNLKKNPWANLEREKEKTVSPTPSVSLHAHKDSLNCFHGNTSSNSELPKPSEFKGRTFNSFLNFSRAFNNEGGDPSKPTPKKALNGSNVLDKSWTIKNMPFSVNNEASSSASSFAFPANSSSHYSRHKFGNAKPSPLASNGSSLTSMSSQSNIQQRGWTTKQSSFSYTTKVASDGNDADDEFDHSTSSFSSVMKNNLGMSRPVSGRTKKAGKLHDAYLKSRGMGNYASGTKDYMKNYDKENEGDDEAETSSEFR